MRHGMLIMIGSLMVAAAALLGMGVPSLAQASTQGMLTIIEPDGVSSEGCPLEHTSVKAEISGFVSQVTVTQVFHNPRKDKIETVYTFPLPGDAAVNDMVMRVGDRVVRGEIKKREEARQVYERARDRGQVASLLDQERPNIFTQSVANIMPGQKVEITITYVEMLPYEDGAFKFVFPMVVGPRFIPGNPTGKQGTGWAADTPAVPDASRITPPVTPEGTRAGHDIDLTVSINAGMPILSMESKLHEIEVTHNHKNKADIALKNKKEIPNRDFVLTYLVAGDDVRSGFLAHKEGDTGYVALILIPPKRVKPEQVAPKEMIFVIDRSGSQHGKPLQKAQETMKYVLDHMNPDDTFNVIDFGSTANMLFSEPKKNTPEYREKARRHIDSLDARGGTWMAPAVELACKTPPPANRLRIVTFMTDGYVGNDFEIISLVERLRGKSRWFPFGAGNSVNRFLLDNMARAGGGEVDYVLLNSSGEEVAKKFYRRISTPVLTDISTSFADMALEQVYPEAAADLWDRKPIIFKARYSRAGKGKVTIKGFCGGKPYEQHLEVTLPEKEAANGSLGSLWARARVDHLMAQDLMGVQRGSMKPALQEEIVQVALAHRIMTQFTSFVAVEETTITEGGKPVTVTVPVEMPDGVSRERIFGNKSEAQARGSVAVTGLHAKRSRTADLRENLGRGQDSSSAPAKAPMGLSHPSAPRQQQESLGYAGDARTPAAVPAEKPAVAPEADTASVSTEQKNFRDEHHPKLAPELRTLLERKDRSGDYSLGKLVVKDGKTMVRVWLTRSNDEVLKKLKEAGLEITFNATTGKMVIGSIAVEKLLELVKLPEVDLVEPAPAG
jgi:Ca-activated chloride channel homolog